MGIPKFNSIDDPIATDHWECVDSGKTFIARIEIGRPVLTDFGDWACPVFIEHYTDRIMTAMGVGPVDALLNAMTLVRAFGDSLELFIPRADQDTTLT